jgi:hypothetical protein
LIALCCRERAARVRVERVNVLRGRLSRRVRGSKGRARDELVEVRGLVRFELRLPIRLADDEVLPEALSEPAAVFETLSLWTVVAARARVWLAKNRHKASSASAQNLFPEKGMRTHSFYLRRTHTSPTGGACCRQQLTRTFDCVICFLFPPSARAGC